MNIDLFPAKKITDTLCVPGDKAICHRALLLSAIATGTTKISNFPNNADCQSTIDCLRALGISIQQYPTTVLIQGKGFRGLQAPHTPLDAGNSGTTMRLLMGLLAGQSFSCQLIGDASLSQRPMQLIQHPLEQMGATITGTAGAINKYDLCAPIQLQGSQLHGISYSLATPSAQIKSALLFAALYASNSTVIHEPIACRDHTERLFDFFEIPLHTTDDILQFHPQKCPPFFSGKELSLPGDFSSAAYWITAALLLPGSEVTIKNVGLNPTRTGFLRICQRMGAQIQIENQTMRDNEPVGDITVQYSSLYSTTISADEIPSCIDEIPLIALLAVFASGITILEEVGELRYKESDRLSLLLKNFRAMGAFLSVQKDYLFIKGSKQLHGATIETQKDHRIAMAFSIAALRANGKTTILDSDCVKISYPEFYSQLFTYIEPDQLAP